MLYYAQKKEVKVCEANSLCLGMLIILPTLCFFYDVTNFLSKI